jgi:Mn-dependent DtxR family transcriptional regulator
VTDHLLELSTTVEPSKTFTVDDEEYKLLTLAHLGPEDEARAMGDSARFENIMNRMARAGNDKEAERLAASLRRKRIDILCQLTTMPREVVERLPIPAQAQLFQAVQRESLGEAGESLSD